MTFVRTKIKLESMRDGEVLRVRLMDGEPLVNVPRAVEDHGHAIVATTALGGGFYELVIRVGG